MDFAEIEGVEDVQFYFTFDEGCIVSNDSKISRSDITDTSVGSVVIDGKLQENILCVKVKSKPNGKVLMRVYADKSTDKSKLPYKLFGDNPIEQFQKLKLSNTYGKHSGNQEAPDSIA